MNLPRYLEIDLSSNKIQSYPLSQSDYTMLLGGKALAAKILYDELPPNINHLSEENILVINNGPLTGTGALSSSHFNIRSGIGVCHCQPGSLPFMRRLFDFSGGYYCIHRYDRLGKPTEKLLQQLNL